MAKTKGKARGSSAKPSKTAKAQKTTKASRPPAPAARAVAPKPVARAAPGSQPRVAPPQPSLPPPPPPPPPPRDEMPAPRDIGRLLRYGERFGAWKIDTRFVQHMQLPVGSGAIAIFDPGAAKSWRVLDRPVGNPLGAAPGQFRVMLSLARTDDGKQRLAALVIHIGRPPIAKWTVAHYRGQKKPKSPEQLPRCPITSGWLALIDAGEDSPGAILMPQTPTKDEPVETPLTDGRRALAVPCDAGDYAAYWAIDATDKPICLVVDFDVFTQKEWKAKAP